MPQNSRLRRSQEINLLDGRSITVIDKLGEGGQGTVYRVCLNEKYPCFLQ